MPKTPVCDPIISTMSTEDLCRDLFHLPLFMSDTFGLCLPKPNVLDDDFFFSSSPSKTTQAPSLTLERVPAVTMDSCMMSEEE